MFESLRINQISLIRYLKDRAASRLELSLQEEIKKIKVLEPDIHRLKIEKAKFLTNQF